MRQIKYSHLAVESQDWRDGVEAVMYVRCMEHKAVPAYNQNADNESECPACAMAELTARAEAAEAELAKLRVIAERLIDSATSEGWAAYRGTDEFRPGIAELQIWLSANGGQGVDDKEG